MVFFCLTGTNDFKHLEPIINEEINSTDIHLHIFNDAITLEYNDTVVLRFTPDSSVLIHSVESAGEYIRDTAIVYIIDEDRKSCAH